MASGLQLLLLARCIMNTVMCLQDWGQHIMHTEQALQKSSPLHVASPEHALAERPSASPGHVPGTLLPSALLFCWSSLHTWSYSLNWEVM